MKLRCRRSSRTCRRRCCRDDYLWRRSGLLLKIIVVIKARRRSWRCDVPLFADDGHFAGIVFIGRSPEVLARHLDELRLGLINERRAVLHTKTQDLFVVSGIARRAIFHKRIVAAGPRPS